MTIQTIVCEQKLHDELHETRHAEHKDGDQLQTEELTAVDPCILPRTGDVRRVGCRIKKVGDVPCLLSGNTSRRLSCIISARFLPSSNVVPSALAATSARAS